MLRSNIIVLSLFVISCCCSTDSFFIPRVRSARPLCSNKSLRRNNIEASSSHGSEIVMINDKNMKALLKDGDRPVLIDAMSVRCGPCKVIEPVIKRLSQKWNGVVVKYSIDEFKNETEMLREELEKNNVLPKSLPSLILYQNGTPVATRSGIISDSELDEFVALCSDGELGSIDFDMPAIEEENALGA